MNVLAISAPTTFHRNFPRSLSLSLMDPLTKKTFHEGINSAIKHRIPYYVISIIETEKDTDKFEVFEGTPFYIHLLNCANKEELFTHPLNRSRILSVHYFALNCFEFNYQKDETDIFCPIDLEKKSLTFNPFEFNSPFPTPCNEIEEDSIEAIETRLVDSLNYHTIEKYEALLREDLAFIAQKVIDKEIFKFQGMQKIIEAMKWIWCSTQNKFPSCESLLKLSELYLSLNEFPNEKEKEIALQILKKTPPLEMIKNEDLNSFYHIQALLELANPIT